MHFNQHILAAAPLRDVSAINESHTSVTAAGVLS